MKQIEDKIILIIMLSNGKILAYEGINGFTNQKKEKFRFKIIKSQTLKKEITDLCDQSFVLSEKALPSNIYNDNKQMIILD